MLQSWGPPTLLLKKNLKSHPALGEGGWCVPKTSSHFLHAALPNAHLPPPKQHILQVPEGCLRKRERERLVPVLEFFLPAAICYPCRNYAKLRQNCRKCLGPHSSPVQGSTHPSPPRFALPNRFPPRTPARAGPACVPYRPGLEGGRRGEGEEEEEGLWRETIGQLCRSCRTVGHLSVGCVRPPGEDVYTDRAACAWVPACDFRTQSWTSLEIFFSPRVRKKGGCCAPQLDSGHWHMVWRGGRDWRRLIGKGKCEDNLVSD